MKGKSVVAGNSPTAELSTFQTLLDAWAAAIATNDICEILEFTEPDWQLIDPAAGPIPLARFLDVVRSGTLVHTAMSLEACSVLQVHDDVGVVIVHGTNTGSWQGNPFTAREWTTDVFVKHNDMWRCRLTAITPDESPIPECPRARLNSLCSRGPPLRAVDSPRTVGSPVGRAARSLGGTPAASPAGQAKKRRVPARPAQQP